MGKRNYCCANTGCHATFLRYYPPSKTPAVAYCSRTCASAAMRSPVPRDQRPWARRQTDQRTAEQRGYDKAHRVERARRIAAMHDGDPCCRCHRPMFKADAHSLHLDHDDHDRTRYRGLAHADCNRKAGARRGQRAAHAARTRAARVRAQGWTPDRRL